MMKEFLFFTNEGYTQSPIGENVENIQLLGVAKGATEKEARKNLINRNEWIEKTGFNKNAIQSKQLLNDELKSLIKILVEYNWESEEMHYQESLHKNHIFLILEKLRSIIA